MDESRIKEIAEIVAEIWLSGKNNSQAFDFHECSSRERWVARLVKLYEGKSGQTRAETLKELKEYLDKTHPYKEDIFPTTNKQAAEFMKSRGFTDENITAISGCLMRHGYWVAQRNINHFEED